MADRNRIDGIVRIIEDAYTTALDRGPDGGDELGSPYWAATGRGLAGLIELSRNDTPALFEVLARLEPPALRWTLAQAATELGTLGWQRPLPDDDDEEDA